MKHFNDYELDNRSLEGLRDRLKELSKSYTPEWNFDVENPDIGSVIGLLFTEQMEVNRRIYNDTLKRFRLELANMIGISLQPAHPSKTIAIMESSQVMNGGVIVKKGTKLLGEDEEGNELIFETVKNVSISNTRITDILEISEVHKKCIFLWEEGKKLPLPIFSFLNTPKTKEYILIRHPLMNESPNEVELIIKSSRNELLHEVRKNGTEIVIERKENGKEQIELYSVSIMGKSKILEPSFLYDGNKELNNNEIFPFGREIMAYGEFFIGEEKAFSQRGANITISFTLEFETSNLQLLQPEEELKLIIRKPKYRYRQPTAHCSIQEVVMEYFNGIGWKKIICEKEYRTIFKEASNKGVHQLSFEAPNDWEPIAVGGYEGNCIRIRIIRADHCYLRPGLHLCPIIKNMEINYDYKGKKILPSQILHVSDDGTKDITLQMNVIKKPFSFKGFSYEGNSLYLGFSNKWENGPVSLFFEFSSETNFKGGLFSFEYSSINGFKPLKVVDHTEGFLHTGTIMFQPPYDMKKTIIEGKERYFIKITDEEGIFNKEKHSFPILLHFHCNGVEVENIETKEIQEYFIDNPKANMKFPLYAENILDAEVWVNEKGLHRNEIMKKLLKTEPEKTRAEYNFLGEIQEFYQKWEETDSFYECKMSERKYIIDRINNQIIFGDGIHAKIPKNTTGTAFSVKVRCCMGKKGNINANNINSFLGNVMFVENVYHPIPAFGGSNLETMDHALNRSSHIISARKRLVSEEDFLRETKSFSDTISQVSCIINKDSIILVLLMNDYKKGSFSFRTLKPALKKNILSKCEAMITKEQIVIIEPIFVFISLHVWLVAEQLSEGFLLQDKWKKEIEDFLEPVKDTNLSGWNIGILPNEKRIRMMLKSLEKNVYIEHYTISVKYQDEYGVHETQLNQLKGNRLAVCCNGTHCIHIRKQE